MDKVLVVYSGGLDSFTLLNLAKKNFDRVYAISFDYGQKHRKELDFASSSTKKLGVEHKIVRLPFEDFLSSEPSTSSTKNLVKNETILLSVSLVCPISLIRKTLVSLDFF